MTDLSEFDAFASRKPTAACKVAHTLASLDADDASKMQAALDASQERVAPITIERWLAHRGVKLTWQSIRNHRSGTCACD